MPHHITQVQRVKRNTRGRDLIVGDIHGCFTKLAMALQEVGFSTEEGDRLFSVGDLVDRGPESIAAVDFIAHDSIYAVQGNHEDMAIRWPNGNMDWGNYAANGGSWMMALDKETQRAVSDALSALPIAIELETSGGLLGIVHAECPMPSWQAFTAALEDSTMSREKMDRLRSAAQWARTRISMGDDSIVEGVRAVIVGHTPMQNMTSLGNTLFIDTIGWRDQGKFTILDAETLQPARKRAGTLIVDDRNEKRPTRHEQYMIDVRRARIGNIMAYMGTILARGLVLEQDGNYEAGEKQP